MAWKNCNLILPDRGPWISAARNPTFLSATIDAVGEKVATVFQAPKTGSIRKVRWRTATVTTGGDIQVRLETVSDADGDPTGTLIHANAYQDVSVLTAEDDTWFATQLIGDISVTQGDVIAAVIQWGTGFNGGIATTDSSNYASKFPYGDVYVSSWTKQANPMVATLEYSDGSVAYMSPWTPPWQGHGTGTFSNANSPDERGLYFKLPFAVRVFGFWALADVGGVLTFKLYDSDGSTVLHTTTVDEQQLFGVSMGPWVRLFSVRQTLLADTWYRFTALPDANYSYISIFDVNAAADWDAWSFGQDCYETMRTDGGTWSQLTTRRSALGLLIDQVDIGGGGGVPLRVHQVIGQGRKTY